MTDEDDAMHISGPVPLADPVEEKPTDLRVADLQKSVDELGRQCDRLRGYCREYRNEAIEFGKQLTDSHFKNFIWGTVVGMVLMVAAYFAA